MLREHHRRLAPREPHALPGLLRDRLPRAAMEGATGIAATRAVAVAVDDGFGGSATAVVSDGFGDSGIAAVVGDGGGGATGTAEATADAVVAVVQGYTTVTVTITATIAVTIAVSSPA